jgi:hypothetical protein
LVKPARPEDEAVHPVLVQGVAAHLHHHRVAAGVEHLAEERVERERVGRGVGGLERAAREAGVDGPDPAGGRAPGGADALQQPGGGGLPVGAGDAEEHQLARRLPVEVRAISASACRAFETW